MPSRSATARFRVLLTTLAAATALSACASTNQKVSDTEQETLGSAGGPAAAQPVPVDPEGNPLTQEQIAAAVEAGQLPASALGASAASAHSGTATGVATVGSAAGPTQAPVATAGGSAGRYTGRVGPGVSDKTINIGITLFKLGGVGQSLGSKVDEGDTAAQAKAAVDYVNANGGIAGRQIVPIYHTFDVTRPGLKDGQSEQEACAKWTQDNKVFAVINITYARLALLDCLAQADVPGMHDGMIIDEQTLAPKLKYWYSQWSVTIEKIATTSTRSFCQRGLFGKGEKVGIQYLDDPAYQRVVDQQFLPELQACGVPKQNVILQAAARGGSQAAPYVSNFKRNDVKTVMFLGEGTFYPLFFMRAAEDQLYRPKYGLHSLHTPALVLQDIAPPEQLKKAIGIGWVPQFDVEAPQDPGPVSASNQLCMQIQRKAGNDMSNRQAAYQSNLYCGGLWWLQQSMAKATGLNSDALQATVDGSGSSFVSPTTFSATFGPTKHWAPAAYRDTAYVNGSVKQEYTSGNKPFIG